MDQYSALYLGDEYQAYTWVGSAGAMITEYTFTITEDKPFLYIVADSSYGNSYMFGYFKNLDTGAIVYTHHPNMMVSATGIKTNVPVTSSSTDIANLNQQIKNANEEKSFTKGWRKASFWKTNI